MSENKNNVKEIFNHIFGLHFPNIRGGTEPILNKDPIPTPSQKASMFRSSKIKEIRDMLYMIDSIIGDIRVELDNLSWAECGVIPDQEEKIGGES